MADATRRVMVSLWAGSQNANGWLGPFGNNQQPYVAEYNSIEYTP